MLSKDISPNDLNPVSGIPRFEVSTVSGSDPLRSEAEGAFMMAPIEVDLRIVPYSETVASSLRPCHTTAINEQCETDSDFFEEKLKQNQTKILPSMHTVGTFTM